MSYNAIYSFISTPVLHTMLNWSRASLLQFNLDNNIANCQPYESDKYADCIVCTTKLLYRSTPYVSSGIELSHNTLLIFLLDSNLKHKSNITLDFNLVYPESNIFHIVKNIFDCGLFYLIVFIMLLSILIMIFHFNPSLL